MIYVFLANGFEETEAIAPIDLLRRKGSEVITVAVGVSGTKVVGSHGIAVEADINEADIKFENIEMTVLPGGLPGADNLYASETVRRALEFTYKNGGYLAAICAAPYILGQLGYLNGKKATCYPGFEEKLTGAEKVSSAVAVDGKIITAEGMGAAVDFGLALVSVLHGKESADALASAVRHR